MGYKERLVGMVNDEPVQKPTLECPSKEFFQILLVDDESSVRALLRAALESEGYTQIEEAGTGEAALSIMLKEVVLRPLTSPAAPLN